MTPALRRLGLTVHVVASVGWVGAIISFLALGIVGLSSQDVDTVRGVYLVAEPVTYFVLVPLALASLLTGLVQSLGSTWGLFRHYWVLAKLALTVVATAILLLYTRTVSSLADVAANPGSGLDELRAATFVLHSGGALVLLLAATALAVYKPKGWTRYGWRKRQELTAVRRPSA